MSGGSLPGPGGELARVRLLTRLEGLLAALGLVAAAVTGEVALVALVAPLAVLSVLGLARRRQFAPSVTSLVEPTVTTPGEPISISVELASRLRQTCEVALVVPAHVSAAGPVRFLCDLSPRRPTTLRLEVRADRPGRFELGRLHWRFGPASRELVAQGEAGGAVVVEVRPPGANARRLPRSERVRALAGDRVAPLRAEGIEFAEVREEANATFSRRVNWRATARRQITCVNSFHPERSTDVVLLVDTFSPSALPAVVAAAVNVAEAYLSRHDRLGIVLFGGVLDWVDPGSGPRQRERVRGALLEAEAYFSFADKTADIIPRRLLPTGALVLAISPLVDDRFTSAVVTLRAQGSDVSVLEIVPTSGLGPDSSSATRHSARRRPSPAPETVLASRIIALEHEELRYRLAGWGIPVATVEPGTSVELSLGQLAVTRRTARQAGRPLRMTAR
ncbi:MAG: DUF58 domain-containing protein [Acidimicrobiales bacterium]